MALVVKIGDRVLERTLSSESLADLELISRETPTIIVHGGGNTVTRIAEKLGVEQKFVTSPKGFRSRHTDAETIQVYTMVMAGKINKEIVRRLQARKIPAVGLSGLDGGLIRAERKEKLIITDERGRRRIVDGGFTGQITSVNHSLLQTLLSANYLPVIAPVAMGTNFESLNVDGDRTAAHVAGTLHAEHLLLLTDVDGVSLEGNPVRSLHAGEAKKSLQKIGPGMITKIYAALEALSMGVEKVIIARGNRDAPFSSALKDSGTVIMP